jgi:hypothetical protein
MKPKILLITIAIFVVAISTSNAQNPITTLQHAGTTQVFYGQNSFVEAYNASTNGDTLNLSVGAFTPPAVFTKGINIFGAGHFPDNIDDKRRTTLTNEFIIENGSSNLYIEGIYVNGRMDFATTEILDNLVFKKMSIFGSHTSEINNVGGGVLKNCLFEDCFISNEGLSLNNHLTTLNLCIRHCIFNGNGQSGIAGANTILDGNIFLTDIYIPAIICNGGAIYKNNIFCKDGIIDCCLTKDEVYYNNIFVADTVIFKDGTYGSNNYFSVSRSDIFVNQTGNTINYFHDYHLKNPELYIGTDGTQVGLYGGIIPFKDGGLPSNPQIISKSVANQTDASGNLNINFTVKAQEN